MLYKKLLFVGLCAALLCGCHRGSTSVVKDDKVAIQKVDDQLDVDGADINGQDDPLESRVEIKVGSSSGFGLEIKGGTFYRGYVDKKTKIATYQLYAVIHDSNWMNWDKAKYLAQEGLVEETVTQVSKNVRCSQFGCKHTEHVILHLDRSVLDKWKSKETTLRFSSSTVSGSKDFDIDENDTNKFIKAMDAVVSYYSKQTLK